MIDFKVIKSGGHCYDGCGWNECSFWEHANKQSRCLLFGGLEGTLKEDSKSLLICNKIFGKCCEKIIELYEEVPNVLVNRGEKFLGEWVVTMGFNEHTVIANDKVMEKAIEKAEELGYRVVYKKGYKSGVLLYVPKKDEIMLGGRYYKES